MSEPKSMGKFHPSLLNDWDYVNNTDIDPMRVSTSSTRSSTGFAPSAAAGGKHPSATEYRARQTARFGNTTICFRTTTNKQHLKRTRAFENERVRFLCISAHLTLIFCEEEDL